MQAPRILDVLAVVVAVTAAMGAISCGGASGGPRTLDDPAAAASAALDERDREPQLPRTAETSTTTTTTTTTVPADPITSDVGGPTTSDVGGPPNPNHVEERIGESISDHSLAIDNCFDRVQRLVSGRPVVQTTRLPCDHPHMFEVFGLVDYPAEQPSRHPGEKVMEDFALRSCYRLFENWVGTIYETSALQIEVLTPGREDFENELHGYRGIHCLIRRVDSEPLLGTARSSRL